STPAARSGSNAVFASNKLWPFRSNPASESSAAASGSSEPSAAASGKEAGEGNAEAQPHMGTGEEGGGAQREEDGERNNFLAAQNLGGSSKALSKNNADIDGGGNFSSSRKGIVNDASAALAAASDDAIKSAGDEGETNTTSNGRAGETFARGVRPIIHEGKPLIPELKRPIWEKPPPGGKVPGKEEFALRREMVEFRAEKNVVVVTFANHAFLDFVLNWVKHLTELGVTNILIGAMDNVILTALYQEGVPVFDLESGMSPEDSGWGTPVFHAMGREKVTLVNVFLSMGVELLICDTDTVWLRNPLPFIARFPTADVLTSSDHLVRSVDDESLEKWQQAQSAYNIGILHFRPTDPAKRLARAWAELLASDAKIWDQNGFNELMRKQMGPEVDPAAADHLFWAFDGTLKLGILPVSVFCSGHTFFVQHLHKVVGLEPYALHATFQFAGTPGKRHRFREAMAFYDFPEYYDPPGGIVSFVNDIPEELLTGGDHTLSTHFHVVNYQLKGLRTALAIALILNRTLIPSGFLFNFITCANYTTEITAWLGFNIATQSVAGYLFMLAGAMQMAEWALAKHKRLVKLQPDSPLPAPSPYVEETDSYTERREPESRPASPVRAVRTGRRVPRPRPPPVPGTHVMTLRPSFVPLQIPLPPPPESSLLVVPDPESDLACGVSPTVTHLLTTVVTDPSFESTAASALVAKLVDFAAACRLDYATSPVAESESDCPPSAGGECALGTDVLKDRQEDLYLRRPVYGLRQAPREWHDTLRTTLVALGFAPSTADPSLFLRTDTSLPPFYVLVYVDDLVFAAADTEALVLQRFGFRYSSPQSTPLPTGHSLSDPPSDEPVEQSGPYPELVGCLIYLMTSTRPDLAYPLSILARYVAPGRHQLEHWEAAKRVLRYLCSTSGMGLVLRRRGPIVVTGHADASWVDELATQRSSLGYTFSLGSASVSWRSTRSSSVLSSSCEAEIYAGAMAAQELRWLTYLLTNLGERPRSSPQRGQLRLAYVATRANTADIFTKALQYGDHQRFSTVLGLLALLFLTSLVTTCSPSLCLWGDMKDNVSLFEHVSGVAPAPPATADGGTRSQWLSRDATARLAIRNHLPVAECTHFGQHRTVQALYDTVVARYSSPATAALGRLLLPYLFPELSAFATAADLVTHLRTSDARYRATVPAEFLATNQPPMFITLYFIVSRLPDSLRSVRDHFLSLDPTSLTVDLLEQHLLAAETSAVAVGAAHGTPRPPFFEGCSPSPLSPSFASAAVADVSVPEDVGAASTSTKRRSSKSKGGRGGGGGSGGGGGGSGSGGGGSGGGGGGSGGGGGCGTGGGSGGSGGGGGGSGGSGGGGGGGSGGGRSAPRRGDPGGGQRQQQQHQSETLSPHAEGDCYRCVPPDPGIAAAALGASASGTPPGTAPAEALHTFTLDSGASRYFFRDSTTLTPLPAPVPVRLADPSGGPIVASSSTVLPCPAVPSGSLSGLHLPSFSTNLVSTAALQDAMVTTTTPGGSSLYMLATGPPQVSASGQVAASCSCRLLSHQTILWHHRLGHPSLPRLRGMYSRFLVSGLPRSLPPLPPSPAPPCLPCIEGRQRAAPHSSSFPPTTAPLQTLHMDVWGTARVSGQGRERYFLLVVDDYTRYNTVFPLCSKGEVIDVLNPWIRTVRLQLRERFDTDLPVLRLHSDRGGEFSSDLLRGFCRGEGILQSFTLPDLPQQNGIAERRIGLVMELNLWPRVSLPETSPTLRWTGKVGDASVFQVWGSRAFVRDMSADKLSARTIPCVFLGFVPGAPGWRFYHPTSRRVLPSQDVTFDEPFPFYRLFPYCSAPPPPSPLFLAPGPPPVDPLLPQGPAPSGAAPGVASGGAASGCAASGGAEPGGAGSEGAGCGGAEPEGVEPRGAETEGAESEGAAPRGAASSGEPAGASSRLSSQQLHEWLVRQAHRRSGAPGAGGAGDTGAGGAAVTAGASGTGGTATTGPGGASTSGAGAAGTSGVGCAGARDPTEPGGAGAGGAGVGGPGAGGVGATGAGVGGTGAGGAGAVGAGAVDPGAGAVLGVPSSTGLPSPFLFPPPAQSQPPLQPASPLPAPSPYTEQSGSLIERREPTSRPVSPVRTARCAPRSRPPPVPGMHAMALRPSSVPLRVPLPAPLESSPPEVPDPASDSARAASPTVSRLLTTAVTDPSFEVAAASALVAELLDFAVVCHLDYATALDESASASPLSVGGECALGTDVLEDMQEDFECLAAAVPRFASMLLAPEGDPDAPDIPTPRSYAEAITGPYSSQWQVAMDAEMASWKSTGTYVDEVPPSRANIVDGMWIFRVKRPSGSPPAFKARYIARGFSQRQGVDYFQTFSPTPKMTTLRWSLRRSVYGLRYTPREWHDTLRTTLAALGFASSTADPSLFLRTDTSLPPFYVLVYVDDLVFATADTEALTLVKSELQKRHTCTDLGPSALRLPVLLATAHSSVYQPLALSSTFGRVHTAEWSVPRACGLPHYVGHVLGGRGPVILTGHADASWVDDSATQQSSQGYTFSLGSGSVSWRSTHSSSVLSSNCEAEIYARAMAAQELRWLTYLLTDLGEQPRSPPVLYVDNKAMIALCQEDRLEHRTKHIALRYFLA
ncbi:unnamed protein product, partial [Closterium sp. NIES-53]